MGRRVARRCRHHPVARRRHDERRRRGRRARRLRPRRLPAHGRHRALLAGDARGRRIRGGGRSGRRHLQRLPGAHRSPSAAGRAAEERGPEVPVRDRRDPRRDRRERADQPGRGRDRPAHPDQPLRGQLRVRRGDARRVARRGPDRRSATSTTRTAASTTSRASATPAATSSASCPTRSARRTRSSAPRTASCSCARCSPRAASPTHPPRRRLRCRSGVRVRRLRPRRASGSRSLPTRSRRRPARCWRICRRPSAGTCSISAAGRAIRPRCCGTPTRWRRSPGSTRRSR